MPMAAKGAVQNVRGPRFVKLDIPARKYGNGNPRPLGEHAIAIRKLKVGGEAYVVPGGGDVAKAKAKLTAVAFAAKKKSVGTFTVREVEIDGEKCAAVWRTK